MINNVMEIETTQMWSTVNFPRMCQCLITPKTTIYTSLLRPAYNPLYLTRSETSNPDGDRDLKSEVQAAEIRILCLITVIQEDNAKEMLICMSP